MTKENKRFSLPVAGISQFVPVNPGIHRHVHESKSIGMHLKSKHTIVIDIHRQLCFVRSTIFAKIWN